jgi:hypothetical protein
MCLAVLKYCMICPFLFFVNGVCEHDSRLVWVLGVGCKLQQWSQLENLLSHYKASRNSVAENLTL